jgi:hypothetical protein
MGMSIGPHEPTPHVGRRPRLMTEPEPKLRIYHHVTGETASPLVAARPKLRSTGLGRYYARGDGHVGRNCASRLSQGRNCAFTIT